MSRRPDYRLKSLDKETDEKNMNLGAGWKNKDNSITIRLSPCVVVSHDPDTILTLFPINEFKEEPEDEKA